MKRVAGLVLLGASCVAHAGQTSAQDTGKAGASVAQAPMTKDQAKEILSSLA